MEAAVTASTSSPGDAMRPNYELRRFATCPTVEGLLGISAAAVTAAELPTTATTPASQPDFQLSESVD